jgi:phage terminase Nu1 subunit (DNA packaging protein)
MARDFHNLGGAQEVPVLNRQAQPDTSELGMTEWTVLARVDGRRTIADLIDSLPLTDDRILDSLRRLKKLGMVNVGATSPEGEASARVRKPRPAMKARKAEKTKGQKKKTSVKVPIPTDWPVGFSEFIFDPQLLEEEVTIDLEKRKQILYYHYHLKRVSYYKVFQLPVEATKRDVRRAYLKLSKEFHPDLFFRKEMGGFRRKVEEIFQWLSKGHDVLIDELSRKRYDALLRGETLAPTPLSDAHAEADKIKNSQKRGREVNNNVVRAAAEAEGQGQWERAWVLYKKQLQLGFDGKTAYRAARCLLELGRGLTEAESLCRQAFEGVDGALKTEAALTLAQILERLQREEEACDMYAEVLRLEPENVLAKMEFDRLHHAQRQVSG